MISNKLDRFQKGPSHPEGEDKLISNGDPTILKVERKTEPTMISVTQSGVSQAALVVRVHDLFESLCEVQPV